MTKSTVATEDLRLMLVDDFPSMRKIITDQLVTLGIHGKNIIQMKNGEEALEALRGGTVVDLIISDWVMPKLTGIELLRAVRATPGLQTLPFLMLTSEGKKEQVVEAIKERVNGYIVKPSSLGTLSAKLTSLFPEAHFNAQGE
jgi:two-component system chemotaxis response regulator CheY